MNIVPFVKPPFRTPPRPQAKPKSRWWFLLVVPAFMFGSLVGMLLFAMLPGILASQFWYGSEAFRHPDLIGVMMRPAMFLGGALAVFGIVHFLRTQDFDDWF